MTTTSLTKVIICVLKEFAFLSVASVFVCANSSLAGPVVYLATGSHSDIQPTIDRFKTPPAGGVRSITWSEPPKPSPQAMAPTKR